MNIYKLSQTINNGWDTYDSCIVYALNEDDAKLITPSGLSFDLESHSYDWALPENVTIELIGTTKTIKEKLNTVILASYNAG